MFGKIIISTIIIVILSSFVFIYQSIPEYQGEWSSKHIDNDVKIFRDKTFGIPHIHAKTLKEGYYGLGFVHAQDRLWQLHLRRMSSQGRLSEIFGYRQEILNIDKYIRNLGYLESCKRIVEKLSEEARIHLQSYADGINDGVKSLQILPIEFKILGLQFQDWQIFDTVAFIKLMSLLNVNDMFHEFMRSKFDELYGRELANILGSVGPHNQFDSNVTEVQENEWIQFIQTHNVSYNQKFQQSSNYTNDSQNIKTKKYNLTEILQSIPEYYSNYIFPTLKASNAWVISGNHTKSGKPHLANDPHLDNNIPSQWYQAEIYFQMENQEYNYIIGGTLPGLPISMSGRSKYLGWGLTTLYSDGGDIYEEEIIIKEGEQLFYKFNDEWIPCNKTVEIIKIKGQEDQSITIFHTHHGPIMQYYLENNKLRDHKGHFYSLQSIVHIDDYESFDGFIKFAQGKDLKQSMEHLKHICYPNNGMVFISHDNHIGYLSTGRLVIKEGHPEENGYVKKNNKEWIRYVPYSEIPMIIDPEKGYIVVANNKFIPENELSWNSQPTSRGRRINDLINQMINKGQKFSILDHIKLQSDTYDSYACNTKDELIQLLKKYDKQKELINEIVFLENWNCKWDSDSSGALLYGVFEYFYSFKFHSQLDEAVIKQWNNFYMFDSFHFKNLIEMNNAQPNDQILNQPYCNGSVQDKCAQNLIESLREAKQYIHDKYGNQTTDWKWGSLHNQVFPHAFSKTPFAFIFERKIPFHSNRRSVAVSSYDLDGSFNGKTGSNYKQIISMDPEESNFFVIDTGISGNPFSKLYTNQMDIWKENKYVKMKFGNRTDYDLLYVIHPN
ncbi:unnamed protein product [Paramecium pentaurelia]|uniref:Penicillin amidase n=1 Tax=Paramecium pentaurelia TaxID=43138 RepID=A0A8S1SZ43_9CILI|nr:unnamed protein product [Paramecium pentaurelia]